MKQHVSVVTAVERTPRVLQMEGLFSVPPSERSALTWDIDLPIESRDWHVGLIVGASGSGKSTVARALWEQETARTYEWHDTRAIVDCFPAGMPIKQIIELLNSVGFSSPPSWVRPFRVLSNGEQFRATMARALAESDGLVVLDEFTSVVDRTVAQIGSCAMARVVRDRGSRFVAVTCHEDVEEWMQPDWVYRPATNEFHWRELQRRPSITLTLERVDASAWDIFRQHHYLDTEINTSAICVVARWHDRPVAFVAALGFPHATRPGWRLHRLVCLPDYQGVGIGVAVADTVSSIFRATGRPVFRTAAHPAVIAHCARSKFWKMTRQPGYNALSVSKQISGLNKTIAHDRLTSSFEYVGPIASKSDALAILPEQAQRIALTTSRQEARV